MNSFTENTRVQVPAALHLCRLGYTYLDDISDYNPDTNILTGIFLRSLRRLNPELDETGSHQKLDKIVGMLRNDDLGKEFYTILSANSGLNLSISRMLTITSGTLPLNLPVRILTPATVSVQT